MAKENKKTGWRKKCMSCSLDCVIARAIAVENKPDSKRKAIIESMFGEGKPKFDSESCPKK